MSEYNLLFPTFLRPTGVSSILKRSSASSGSHYTISSSSIAFCVFCFDEWFDDDPVTVLPLLNDRSEAKLYSIASLIYLSSFYNRGIKTTVIIYLII